MYKKNLIIAAAVCLFSLQIYAQAPAKEKEQSNAEAFSAKAGTLMQKEFVEIGTVKKAKVQVLYYTDLISNIKKTALKFEFEFLQFLGYDLHLMRGTPLFHQYGLKTRV